MNPKNVNSTLLLGNNFDYVLFKTAIFFAESGMSVWFISPEAFEKIPENIVAPEKEILQLITFFYLTDHKNLLIHLNSIHLWHKIPDVIILSNLETYCNLNSEQYNSILTGLVVTTLLDSASVCAKKKEKAHLIVTSCIEPSVCVNRMQVLHDIYFPHIIQKSGDDETILKEIVDYYTSKNSVS